MGYVPRVRSVAIVAILALASVGPLASADLGARDGFAVYITYPQVGCYVGAQIEVTVHVFYRGEYHDADEVYLSVGYPGNRYLILDHGSTGRYTCAYTIDAGDVRDWSGRLTLEAEAELTDGDGLLMASDQVDLYIYGTQIQISLYSADTRDQVPRPGEDLDYMFIVRDEHGPIDVDEGYPEVTVREEGSYTPSEDLETNRTDVGTYTFSFHAEDNITHSVTYRVEILIEKTIGPITYQTGGYFTEDVDVLEVWARVVSSTVESTDLEIAALDDRGRGIPGAVFDVGWHYKNSSGRWPEFDGSWTADDQGIARVTIDTPELDYYYVYVEGTVTGDELVQEFDRGFAGQQTITYPPDPLLVKTDVEGLIAPGERRTIIHTVTFDGEPVTDQEMFVYYTDEHNIYHHGAETTDAQGQFDVTVDIPADLEPDEPRWSDWVSSSIQWGNNTTHTGFPYYHPPDWYEGDVEDLWDENLTIEVGPLHPGRAASITVGHHQADGEAEDCMIVWRIISDDNWTRWVRTTSGYSIASCQWTGDGYEGSLMLPSFVTEDTEIEVMGAIVFIGGMFDHVVRNGLRGLFPTVVPPEPPGAPRALVAVQDIDTVTLAWEAPADDGGSAISGYVVYRGTSGDTMEVLTTMDRARSYVDTTITMGQTYHYAVAAVTSVGEGTACEQFVLETVEYRAPSPPVNLSDRFDKRRVYLEWEPPEDDGGQPVTHYSVLRGDGPHDLEEVANTTLTTYTDTAVEVGRYYYYAVRATNLIGTGETCEARRVRADYIVPPSPPEDPSAAYIDGVVVINWSAPVDDGGDPITGYVLARGSSPGDLEHLADVGLFTNYSDPDVEPDVMYYYTVSAVNGMGAGPPCAKVTAYVPAIEPPSTPEGVTLEFVQDRVKVSWLPSEDDGGSPVTGYRVLRGVDEGDLEEMAVVTVGTTYYDLEVERERTYRYTVVAMNAEEESEPSDEVTLHVPREATEDGFTVSWYVFGAMAAVAAAVLVVAFVTLSRRNRGSA